MVVLSLSISHKFGIFLAHIKKKSYLCAAKVINIYKDYENNAIGWGNLTQLRNNCRR